MKEFIEAGIKGGFDVADSLKKLGYKNVDEFPYNHFDINDDDGVEQVDFCFEKKLSYYQVITVSFQALIFSTDIVECVVGKAKNCCDKCLLNHGSKQKRKYLWVSCDVGFFGSEVKYKENCASFMLRDPDEYSADYHRSIMAQEPYCKDIEKLKEYCRGLVK